MTAPEVRVWSVIPGLLSEGPRWHEERQELLWVDILGCQMHRGTLSADDTLERIETISVDRHIGAVAPAVGGGYVLAAGLGFLLVDETGSVRELAQAEEDHTEVRMNDGACDATRCSSPPRGQTSTTTRWRASRTQANFSRSTGSTLAASLACRTAAGHHGHLSARAAGLRSRSGEDLGLLTVELLGRNDAPVPQVGELGQLIRRTL